MHTTSNPRQTVEPVACRVISARAGIEPLAKPTGACAVQVRVWPLVPRRPPASCRAPTRHPKFGLEVRRLLCVGTNLERLSSQPRREKGC